VPSDYPRHLRDRNATRIKMLRRMRDRPEGFGRGNMKTLARHRRRVEGKHLAARRAAVERAYAQTGLVRL
jgi:hypothetical protein